MTHSSTNEFNTVSALLCMQKVDQKGTAKSCRGHKQHQDNSAPNVHAKREAKSA